MIKDWGFSTYLYWVRISHTKTNLISISPEDGLHLWDQCSNGIRETKNGKLFVIGVDEVDEL